MGASARGRDRQRQDRQRCRGHDRGPPRVPPGHHELFNNIILLPDFGQARAKLECDTKPCCLRARFASEHPDSSAPSSRGSGADRAPSRIASGMLAIHHFRSSKAIASAAAGPRAGFFVFCDRSRSSIAHGVVPAESRDPYAVPSREDTEYGSRRRKRVYARLQCAMGRDDGECFSARSRRRRRTSASACRRFRPAPSRRLHRCLRRQFVDRQARRSRCCRSRYRASPSAAPRCDR